MSVMMALGPFRFSMRTIPYESLRRSTAYRWPRQNRVGRRPALQFTGQDVETVELAAILYPGYTGGLLQIEKIRIQAGKGQPYMLTDGLGKVWGKFCIESIEQTGTVLFPDGAPRRIEFSLKLAHYGEDD